MKDINFFGKLAQLQTMQYFFRALFNEGFKPPAPSVCADGEVLPVSQTEVYRTVLQNSGEPCPLLGSKARQKESQFTALHCRFPGTVASTTSLLNFPMNITTLSQLRSVVVFLKQTINFIIKHISKNEKNLLNIFHKHEPVTRKENRKPNSEVKA